MCKKIDEAITGRKQVHVMTGMISSGEMSLQEAEEELASADASNCEPAGESEHHNRKR